MFNKIIYISTIFIFLSGYFIYIISLNNILIKKDKNNFIITKSKSKQEIIPEINTFNKSQSKKIII